MIWSRRGSFSLQVSGAPTSRNPIVVLSDWEKKVYALVDDVPDRPKNGFGGFSNRSERLRISANLQV